MASVALRAASKRELLAEGGVGGLGRLQQSVDGRVPHLVAPVEIDGGTHHAEKQRVLAIDALHQRASLLHLIFRLIEAGQLQAELQLLHRVGQESDLPLEGEDANVVEAVAFRQRLDLRKKFQAKKCPAPDGSESFRDRRAG